MAKFTIKEEEVTRVCHQLSQIILDENQQLRCCCPRPAVLTY